MRVKSGATHIDGFSTCTRSAMELLQAWRNENNILHRLINKTSFAFTGIKVKNYGPSKLWTT